MVCLLSVPKSGFPVHRILDPLCKTCVFCSQRFHRFPIVRSWKDTCEFDNAAQYEHCSGTMSDVIRFVHERIGVEPGYNAIPKCRGKLLEYHPEPKDLPCRSMKDSFTRAILELSSHPIRERYVNHLGRVRTARLMEELDMFAVWICYRHVNLPTLPKGIPLPYVFVTVLVDSVHFDDNSSISADEDILLCGHVSWTGRSSMEISVYIQQSMRTICKAILVMLARNATNTGPAPVNPLEPANEIEQLCHEKAERRNKRRIARQLKSVLNVPPGRSDAKLMYDIFKRITRDDITESVESRELPPNCCWMSDSFQTTILHSFPDNRNYYNHIFAGFIIQKAIEITSITASMYTGCQAMIESILDVTFHSPVKVNSYLKLNAYLVYTCLEYLQFLTIVEVLDAHNMEQITTVALHLTYKAEANVKEVLPFTYQEALWYITGRKQFMAFWKLRNKQTSKLHAH